MRHRPKGREGEPIKWAGKKKKVRNRAHLAETERNSLHEIA